MKKEFEKIVKFEIKEKDINIFNSKLENYKKIIQMIENFDFDKYKEYLDDDYMFYMNTISLKFSDLRNDEYEDYDQEQLEKIIKCPVEFKNEYVSLKNEK
ncbi:MAG: hypothetical protein K2I36_02165 [Ureaplasma sp.]|nr:hypothetical protein [Ureaplasma sp.]